MGIALWECSKPWLGVGFLYEEMRSCYGPGLSEREKTLIEYLGGIRSFLIDKKTNSSQQLLRVLRENRNSLCISSKRVVPVKYSRQKDYVSKIPIVN